LFFFFFSPFLTSPPFNSPPISPHFSFNNYPGWYAAPGNVGDAATTWKNNGDWVHANHPTHPFTVSETGGGGIYEWVNASSPAPGQFWSQKYQDSLVMADATYLLGDDRYTGWCE
jgi:hypothetical protein